MGEGAERGHTARARRKETWQAKMHVFRCRLTSCGMHSAAVTQLGVFAAQLGVPRDLARGRWN